MPDETKFLVKVESGTATLAVIGKAGYLNCSNVGEFLTSAIDGGCARVVVLCRGCTGMDSTFLGILAGAALRLKKIGGKMFLADLSERNRELVENLGLSKFAALVDSGAERGEGGENIGAAPAAADAILGAHENLVEADGANLSKFRDVISFLKRGREEREGL